MKANPSRTSFNIFHLLSVVSVGEALCLDTFNAGIRFTVVSPSNFKLHTSAAGGHPMRIAGFQKSSLIDFPGRICAVVFTQGCPWRCPYCHNPGLVVPDQFDATMDEKEVFEHLRRRRNQLDGLTISGGEPTVQSDLSGFCARVKDLGMEVKLDTNGIHPRVIGQLIAEDLVDFIAMDIKAGKSDYPSITGERGYWEPVAESLDILKESSIEYELRCTYIPEFHSRDVLLEMRDQIHGVPRFALQAFRPGKCLHSSFDTFRGPTPEEMHEAEQILSPSVGHWVSRS